MNTSKQFVTISRTHRAFFAAAATIASALVFVGVLSLATIEDSAPQRAQSGHVQAIA